MASPDPRQVPAEAELPATIRAFLDGQRAAAERLSLILEPPVRGAARAFLGPESADVDDVVQDTLLAVIGYLERAGRFSGNLVTFAITVARNRCRNLLNWRRRFPHVPVDAMADWLARPDRSPLDLVEESDLIALLQRVLDELDPACRDLLRALYLEEVSVETYRQRTGLGTVQGVYYRKDICLERAYRRLNRLLADCSPAEDPARGGTA